MTTYVENPNHGGRVPDFAFVKHGNRIYKTSPLPNGSVALHNPSQQEIRALRDNLAKLKHCSPNDYRRWGEINAICNIGAGVRFPILLQR